MFIFSLFLTEYTKGQCFEEHNIK